MTLNVPKQMYAGESIKFSQQLADYLPSDGWALEFSISNGIVMYLVSSTPNVTTESWDISVLPTVSKDFIPAKYKVYARVTKGTDVYVVDESVDVLVKTNPFSGTGLDGRSFNERMVDILQAAYEDKASDNVLEITLFNRHIKGYDRNEQLKYLNYFKQEVAKEKLIEANKSAYGSRLMDIVG